ncbi:MAG TPA: hypothetical protein VMU93_01985 [Caulobacteraceae bacterium]|nr:hypothetical protein [Caulobacteraceae bacterium]
MSADGAWKTTINSPMGVQEGTLTIATSGATFSGKMAGAQGTQDISGKVDGDTLTWGAKLTQPFPIDLEFNVTVNGDAMEGSVKAGAFGSSPLKGVRA